MTNIHTIRLHIGDWLGGTHYMTATEVGCYIRLLIAHYNIGEEGLQDDDIFLSRVCGVSLKQWKSIKKTVLSKFYLDASWKNSRVIDELLRIKTNSSNASDKSLKGWETRYAAAKLQQSYSKASLKPIALSHNISKEKYKKESSQIESFGIHEGPMKEWLDYKKSRGESYKSNKSIETCFNRLKKMSGEDPIISEQIIQQSIANNYSGLFPLKSVSGNSPRKSYDENRRQNFEAYEKIKLED